MPDFTFLTEEQIWGDDALAVIKNYGTKVAPTDLTVILGGYVTGGANRTSEGDLTCASWSASSDEIGNVRCVFYGGDKGGGFTFIRDISARPALPPSEASKISPSEERAIDGIRVAEYGEYPQTVADERTSAKLERLHSSRSLRPTGKNYTFDSVDLEDYDTPFKATSFSEYEMDGKKYIRVLGRPYDDDSKLSTGKQVEEGKPYWVQVQPIEWLMDESRWMVSKKCLFAGIQFDTKSSYDVDFSKTSIKRYLDTYFAKELVPSNALEQKKEEKDKLTEEEWDKTWGTIHFDKDTDKIILEKAETLLNKGVDIDMAVIQNYNRTPLMCAVTTGKEKFVDYLISNGADVDKTDSYGFTPLMVASVKGNKEIAEKLLNAKADVTKRRKGISALDMARKYGHEDIANLLTAGIKKLSILAKSRRAGR